MTGASFRLSSFSVTRSLHCVCFPTLSQWYGTSFALPEKQFDAAKKPFSFVKKNTRETAGTVAALTELIQNYLSSCSTCFSLAQASHFLSRLRSHAPTPGTEPFSLPASKFTVEAAARRVPPYTARRRWATSLRSCLRSSFVLFTAPSKFLGLHLICYFPATIVFPARSSRTAPPAGNGLLSCLPAD